MTVDMNDNTISKVGTSPADRMHVLDTIFNQLEFFPTDSYFGKDYLNYTVA